MKNPLKKLKKSKEEKSEKIDKKDKSGNDKETGEGRKVDRRSNSIERRKAFR